VHGSRVHRRRGAGRGGITDLSGYSQAEGELQLDIFVDGWPQ
jgi:hypothetical protein